MPDQSYSSQEIVVQQKYESADKFLQALSAEKWTSEASWCCSWIFRGQSSSNWPLTPSAWRTPSTNATNQLAILRMRYTKQYGEQIKEQLQRDHRNKEVNGDFVVEAYAQAQAEFDLILQFVQLADKLGHRVPDLERYTQFAKQNFLPEVNSYPLVRFLPYHNAASALAQHHGIPTRSIDFTQNPLYAAYFAAIDVPKAHNTNNCIAVWAIQSDLLNEGCDENLNSDYSRFIVHTVPAAENSYLQSQQALFVHPMYGCAHIAKYGHVPNLEDFALKVQMLTKKEIRAPRKRAI